MKSISHADLKENDQVIFIKHSDILGRNTEECGSVLFVVPHERKVCVCYLEGYKSRSDMVPFEKVIAKYDEKGTYMKFGVFSGPSVLLQSREGIHPTKPYKE